MADNIVLNAGAGGSTLGTDDVGGTHYQLIKLGYGALDSFTIVTGSVGLPTDPLDRSARDCGKIDVAALDEYTPVDIDSGGGTVNAIPVTLGVSGAGGVFIGGDLANGLDVDVTRVPTDPFGADADAAAVAGSISAKLRWLTAVGIAVATQLPAGTNNIGDVDVLTVPADPFGANADAAAVAGSISAKLRWLTSTGIAVATSLPAGTNNIGDMDVLTVPADPFGANADAASATGSISAKLRFIAATGIPITSIAAGDTNIGNVDVLTVPADPFGVNADAANPLGSISAKLKHLAAVGIAIATQLPAGTNVIGYITGSVAHDSPDSTSPNPMKIGAYANQTLANETLVADADRVNLNADLDGVQIVKAYAPFGDLGTERRTDIGGVATQLSTFFGATSNVRNMISAITVTNTHASTNGYVDILDGSTGPIIWTIPAPFAGGAHIPFNPPLRQPSVNTALGYKVSAGIATMILSFHGFRSKA